MKYYKLFCCWTYQDRQLFKMFPTYTVSLYHELYTQGEIIAYALRDSIEGTLCISGLRAGRYSVNKSKCYS